MFGQNSSECLPGLLTLPCVVPGFVIVVAEKVLEAELEEQLIAHGLIDLQLFRSIFIKELAVFIWGTI